MTTESELETETETDRESVVDRCVVWCVRALNDAAVQPKPDPRTKYAGNCEVSSNILKDGAGSKARGETAAGGEWGGSAPLHQDLL